MVNSIDRRCFKPLTCGYAGICLLKEELFPTRRRLFQYLDSPYLFVDKMRQGLDNPQTGPSYAQVSQQLSQVTRADLW